MFVYNKYKQTLSYIGYSNFLCKLNKVNILFTTSRISKITNVETNILSVYALFDVAE